MKKPILLFGVATIMACHKVNPTKGKSQQEQTDILTKRGIDSTLTTFKSVQYTALPEHYKSYSHPDDKYYSELKNRSFYVIDRTNIYNKIVGNFCVKDFLAKDDYYKAYKESPDPELKQYWLIDVSVLYMMLDLIHKLDEHGYNKYGFSIRTCHRHPTYNAEIDGATYSQHMFGKAIDINILDINNDGEATQDDKSIVYEMLENIVGNKGGLGKYPGSMHLHFDCRGFKARWDVP